MASETIKGQIDSVQTELQSTETVTGTAELKVDVSIVEEVEGIEI